MRSLRATAALLVAGLAASAQEAPPTEDERAAVARLIRRLDAESLEDRAAAERDLDARMPRILPQIEEALKAAESAQVKASLGALIDRHTVVRLGKLMERVREAAKGTAWRERGWTDPLMDRELRAILERLGRAARRPGLAPAVWPGEADPAPKAGSWGLEEKPGRHVLSGGAIGYARRSVILCDGSLDIGYATECLIVATGSVCLSHGNQNVIIAGRHLAVAHDGEENGLGSVMAAGKILLVSHANASVITGGRMIVAHAHHVDFVNASKLQVAHDRKSSKWEHRGLDVSTLTGAPCPLKDLIQVCERPEGESDSGKAWVRPKGAAAPLGIAVGRPLVDTDGTALPGLEGWRVALAGYDLVEFTNGAKGAAFMRLEDRPVPVEE